MSAPSPEITPLSHSTALVANLRETAVGPLKIDPRHQLLRQIVSGYSGILPILDNLLLELGHPYRNWALIVPELRGFLLRNLSYFVRHPQGPTATWLFLETFLRAQAETPVATVARLALDGISAVLDKLVTGFRVTAPFMPMLSELFTQLSQLPGERLLLLAQSHTPIKKSITTLLRNHPEVAFPAQPLRRLAVRSLHAAYEYWLGQPDPITFWEPGAELLNTISHQTLTAHHRLLLAQEELTDDRAAIDLLLPLPSYVEIVSGYRQAANQLGNTIYCATLPERSIESRKLRFMFYILECDGLSMLHEEILREVNRNLVLLLQLQPEGAPLDPYPSRESPQRETTTPDTPPVPEPAPRLTTDWYNEFFLRTFEFLNTNVVKYPHTALSCVETLGNELFKRNDSKLIEIFLGQAVRFGFQPSLVKGVGTDWKPVANPAHLFNIRVWLRLITNHPWYHSTLLSALIINLKLTGTCIRDTDMFQKEVTNLLNSEIPPVYNLTRQFLRTLPVFFNEIGAEGELRVVSTELDELTRRRDRQIHFLRKQCHVESSNLTVELARAILDFWRTAAVTPLHPFVPPEFLPDPASGAHPVFQELCTRLKITATPQLLALAPASVTAALENLTTAPGDERRRVELMIQLYRLLHQKYHPGVQEVAASAAQAAVAELPVAARLAALAADPTSEPLPALLDILEELQRIILSRERFPIREEIYKKRHIAVDIPSVFGRYQERKFDALALSFRLEQLAILELERLSGAIPEGFVTRATFFRVVKYTRYFLRALALDGIASRKLHDQLAILERSLELSQLSFDQYLDIFRGLSDGVKGVIYTYFTSQHRDNLMAIIPRMAPEVMLPHYAALHGPDHRQTTLRITDALSRELITETFGLQQFDNFIRKVLRILNHQEKTLSPAGINLLMNYDPAKLFCPLHHPNQRANTLLHMGAKGFNLMQLAQEGIKVPPGVVLTTEFHRSRQVVRLHPPAWEEFQAQLREQITYLERTTGLQFGSPQRPLLLSVRSGALISMPGMMQTIHNVGINPTIVQGLISQLGEPYCAWDNYRRFIQSWSMAQGMDRARFNEVMRATKQRHGVKKKREFTPEQMATLAQEYLLTATEAGFSIPDDPWEQLVDAINLVVASWAAKKAQTYRRLMRISNNWGTAAVIQAMVYGNLNRQAGTGVLFTAHPHRKLNRVVLWGDYTPGNQGEDIVSGLVATQPISLEQCQYSGRDFTSCLEFRFPKIFARLLGIARHLIYNLRWNPQEMEFTFTGPREEELYILQTRAMATGDEQVLLPTFQPGATPLATGIGINGGALCGKAVFSLEQIATLRNQEPETRLILVRYDTVPEDITEISQVDGILTARGGQTSHAAIVAANLGKSCVVGCEELVVMEDNRQCRINGVIISWGDPIAIDGRHGSVLLGWHPIEHQLPHAGE